MIAENLLDCTIDDIAGRTATFLLTSPHHKVSELLVSIDVLDRDLNCDFLTWLKA